MNPFQFHPYKILLKDLQISAVNVLLEDGTCVMNIHMNDYLVWKSAAYKWKLPVKEDDLKVQSDNSSRFRNIHFMSK